MGRSGWTMSPEACERIAEGRRAYFARMSEEEHADHVHKVAVGVQATMDAMSQEERNEKFGHGEASVKFYEEHPEMCVQIGNAVSDSWKDMSSEEYKCRTANMSKGIRSSALVELARTDAWREAISESAKLFWTDEKRQEQGRRALEQWAQNHWGSKRLGVHIYYWDYPSNWDFIRFVIRERDGNVCKLCGCSEDLHVHHVNYDPTDCRWENLATLCISCHTRTNHDREYWQDYFTRNFVEGVDMAVVTFEGVS